MNATPEIAFPWIVEILNRRNIPFQVSGGIAARVYGALRPMNDIDLEVPTARLVEIVPDVQPYIDFGPAHHVDERWDLPLLVLDYHGQIIDICGDAPVRICDARTGEWKDMSSELSTAEIHTLFGLEVPIMAPASLAEYKAMLAGDHQQVDIAAVKEYMRKRAEKA